MLTKNKKNCVNCRYGFETPHYCHVELQCFCDSKWEPNEELLRQENKTLLERNEALAGMLKRLEWNGDNYLPDSRCRICGGNELNGHAPDCMLAKLLEGGK